MPTSESEKELVTKKLLDKAVPTWLSYIRLYNLCISVLDSQLVTIGYTVAQYEALTHLYRDPGISQKQLAARCFVAKSGMSMLLKKMEEDRWIARTAHSTDARSKLLELTPLGQKQVKQMLIVQAKVVGAMAMPLSTKEMDQFAQIIKRISASLELIKN